MTDTDAVQRYARRRDPEAFAHLVESYQQMVYAACLRRLGHEADARDATQDTFVKLATSAGDIRATSGGAGGSVVGWLHRCATTTSIDLIRRESRRRGRERAVAVPDQAPSADPAWEEVRSALDEALVELPEAQRDLIVQRYLVGRRQTQLAAEAGVSESMISRRVRSAVDELRERLKSKGFGVGLAALTTGLAAESAVALPAGLSAGLASVGVAGVSGGAGAGVGVASPATSGLAWLGLGGKIKMSTAVLGSLGIHAVLVAGYLAWSGNGPASPALVGMPSGQMRYAAAGSAQAAEPSGQMITGVGIQAQVVAAEAPAIEPTPTEETERQFVYITGNVKRPGTYLLPDAEKGQLSLHQLIVSAGGPDGESQDFQVTLVRRGEAGGEATVYDAPFDELQKRAGPIIGLEADDLVSLRLIRARDREGGPSVLTNSERPANEGGGTSSSEGPEGFVKLENLGLSSIAAMAYDMTGTYRLQWNVEVPPGRFDAEIRDPAWRDILREVLREEFGLQGRIEQKASVVYALRLPADGNHRLKESRGDGSSMSGSRGSSTWTGGLVDGLVANLGHWLETEVSDETGLEERFDFTINVDRNAPPQEIAAAIKRDLGLELVSLGDKELPIVVMSGVKN